MFILRANRPEAEQTVQQRNRGRIEIEPKARRKLTLDEHQERNSLNPKNASIRTNQKQGRGASNLNRERGRTRMKLLKIATK